MFRAVDHAEYAGGVLCLLVMDYDPRRAAGARLTATDPVPCYLFMGPSDDILKDHTSGTTLTLSWSADRTQEWAVSGSPTDTNNLRDSITVRVLLCLCVSE